MADSGLSVIIIVLQEEAAQLSRAGQVGAVYLLRPSPVNPTTSVPFEVNHIRQTF